MKEPSLQSQRGPQLNDVDRLIGNMSLLELALPIMRLKLIGFSLSTSSALLLEKPFPGRQCLRTGHVL